MRGLQLMSKQKRAENFEAQRLFRNAIERDPGYTSAYAGLGRAHLDTVNYGWTGSPQAAVERAYGLARKAIAIDENSDAAHRLAASVYFMRRQYDFGLVESERAIALNPNDAVNHAMQGVILLYSGYPDGAILSLETALRFDPLMNPAQLAHLGLAYYLKARYEDAIKILERCVALNPDFVYGHSILAAVHGQRGDQQSASRAAEAVRRLDPYISVDAFGRRFRNATDKSRVADGLRKAGLE
jgi:tetratricopeptide (TPR) repeat protein